jgi:hypothetical protein
MWYSLRESVSEHHSMRTRVSLLNISGDYSTDRSWIAYWYTLLRWGFSRFIERLGLQPASCSYDDMETIATRTNAESEEPWTSRYVQVFEEDEHGLRLEPTKVYSKGVFSAG